MAASDFPAARVSFLSASDDVLVMRLCGELDLRTTEIVECALRAARPRGSHLVLDLSQLGFCDCRGVGMLVCTAQYYVAGGGWLRLAAPAGLVARILSMLGIGAAIPIYGCVADAVADVAAGSCRERVDERV